MFLRAVPASCGSWQLPALCPSTLWALTLVLVSSACAPSLGAAYLLRCPGNEDRGGESPGWAAPLAEAALRLPGILWPTPASLFASHFNN